MNLTILSEALRSAGMSKIYLIHEEYREVEARDFAVQLKEEGFEVMVAADYRKDGDEAVSQAIKESDGSIVLAFDDETVRRCKRLNVQFVDVRGS